MPKPYWPEISEIHETIRLSIFDELHKIATMKINESKKIKAILKYIDKSYETADPLSDREKQCIRRQKDTINETIEARVKAGVEKAVKEIEKEKK